MMQPIRFRMGASEWGILILLSILWGGSFFFLEVALGELPPLTLVLCRVGLSALLMVAFMAITRRTMSKHRGLWPALFLLAALNNAIPFSLFAYAQTHIASGLASILNATTPLWGVIVAHFLTADEKATPAKLAGVSIGILGVAIMIGGDLWTRLDGDLTAQLACLVATFSYALAGVYGRRFRTWGVGPLEVATGQLIAATVLILPLALLIETPWHLPFPGTQTLLALAGLALLSTTVAYFLYFSLIQRAGATNALLVTLLIPATAILLGTLVLGEVLRPRHWAGMAFIAAGLAAIDGRLFDRFRRRPVGPAQTG
ncbi:ABC transporter permease [Sphingopyxis sp. Root214]|uniref:DMT family transporter n=1 Tax=unclassified Sphingopyxis TaxID=2614943 RepID=UPI0006F1C7FB|nr:MULTISPECIES: DMT family transporter [unclassified Sphingopyxis]KQZ71944.1 ABC transporter permease [Sphingopyxis sp. Root154]KRC05852.1 ABC transporter permease [Sphingopyxis sp. Root214]